MMTLFDVNVFRCAILLVNFIKFCIYFERALICSLMMASFFEENRDVAELIQYWRWEEPIKHTTLYPNIQTNDSYDPKHYNYSYSEWRKCRKYYKTSIDEYYKDFIGTLMPLRHGDNPSLHPNNECIAQIHEAIAKCISHNIPPSHLLIGTLYSSYHLVSPYILIILMLKINWIFHVSNS